MKEQIKTVVIILLTIIVILNIVYITVMENQNREVIQRYWDLQKEKTTLLEKLDLKDRTIESLTIDNTY